MESKLSTITTILTPSLTKMPSNELKTLVKRLNNEMNLEDIDPNKSDVIHYLFFFNFFLNFLNQTKDEEKRKFS